LKLLWLFLLLPKYFVIVTWISILMTNKKKRRNVINLCYSNNW